MNHYFDRKQTSKLLYFDIDVNVFDLSFKIKSASGIFSKNELDSASKILIENTIPFGEVLDMGCGNGVIGISLLKKYSSLSLTFCDINERAVMLTKKNLESLNLKGNVINCYLFEKIDFKEFDLILSNPPYAAGRKVIYEMIEESVNYLKDGGKLNLVARHSKGGKMIEKKMFEVFGNVKYLAKKSGFRVYSSTKNEGADKN
ncbi:MAG: class I SAM-dependent methyltransferase [Candidatus Woesearchaeota archaeon]